MERESGGKSTARNYGWGLVAARAGLMVVASVVGGTFSLVNVGISFGLIVGIGFNVLFWYWIAMGAWRRTSWSATAAHASGTEPG